MTSSDFEDPLLRCNMLPSTHWASIISGEGNSSIEIALRGTSNLCHADDKSMPERALFVTNTRVLLRSSSDSHEYVLGHWTTQNFSVPNDELFSDQYCREIVTELLDLMNIPFSLDTKQISFIIKCAKVNEKKSLENFQDLIMELVACFCKLTDSSPQPLYSLIVRKIVNVPEHEFEELRSLRDEHRPEYDNVVKELPESRMRWRMAALRVLERLGVEENGWEWVEEQCSICQEEAGSGASELIRLPCSHVYHKDCILMWINDKQSCPCCRATTPKIRTHDEDTPFEISCKSRKLGESI